MDKILKALLVIFVIAGNVVVVLAMNAGRLEMYIGIGIVALSAFFLLSMYLDSRKADSEDIEQIEEDFSEQDSKEILEYYKKQIETLDDDNDTLALSKEEKSLEELKEEAVKMAVSDELVEPKEVIEEISNDKESVVNESEIVEESELEEKEIKVDDKIVEKSLESDDLEDDFAEKEKGEDLAKELAEAEIQEDDSQQDIDETRPSGKIPKSTLDFRQEEPISRETSPERDELKVDDSSETELEIEEDGLVKDTLETPEYDSKELDYQLGEVPKLKEKLQEVVISLPEERNGKKVKYFRRKTDENGVIRYYRIRELTILLKTQDEYQDNTEEFEEENYQTIGSEEDFFVEEQAIAKPVVSTKIEEIESMDVSIIGEELDSLKFKGSSYYKLDELDIYDEIERVNVKELPKEIIVDEKSLMQLLLLMLREYENKFFVVKDVALSDLFIYSNEDSFEDEYVDFIIQDEKEYPVIGIQLYNYLDTLKDKIYIATIFNKAKLPLLAFHEESRYKVADIKSLIENLLK